MPAFAPTELMALVFSRKLLAPPEGTEVQASLDAALSKVQTTLPLASEAYLRQLQGLFVVGLGPHKRYREHLETVDRLTGAIAKNRMVQLRYYRPRLPVPRRRSIEFRVEERRQRHRARRVAARPRT